METVGKQGGSVGHASKPKGGGERKDMSDAE